MDITGFFKDGRLQVIPRKQKAKDALLDALIDRFEFGRDYTEKEVNRIIKDKDLTLMLLLYPFPYQIPQTYYY